MATVLQPFRAPELPKAPPSAPEPALMTVTPEMAREWLSRNDGNRPVRYNFVAQLARDMRAGSWDVNGETIKVAADGTLLDGQHRLYACAQAQVPFATFVVTGLAREAQRTMDTGRKRMVADHLALAGERNAPILASIARWSMIWLRGGRGKVRGDLEPTHAEMLALIEADPRLRDAAEFAAKARQDVKSVRPSTWGMAWLLFAGINDLAAVAFLARARDGADIGVGHPAHTLRARIYRAREMQERLTEWEQLALFCIAWNHFQAGTQVVRLNLPRGGLTPKNFPEPK